MYKTALLRAKADQANRYNLYNIFSKHYLHVRSTGELTGITCFDTMLEKVLRVAGHLRTAGTTCPQVIPSMKTCRHQPNTLLPLSHSQLH